MSNKLTRARLETLVDTLNDLICEDDLLTREQRENMVRTVATIGGLEQRLSLATAEKEAKKQVRADKPKKPRAPDLVFPRSGKIWTPEDSEVIDMIDNLPDEALNHHILRMSDKLQRTPYAVAAKIVAKGRMDDEWAKTWKDAAKPIREQYARQHPDTGRDETDTPAEESHL